MSYDLFLKNRNGLLDRTSLAAWLEQRPNWKVKLPECFYGNEATGVYFGLNVRDGNGDEASDDEYPIAININYFRPSYFILEIEPEITALVRRFDLIVSDPQMRGMGEGEYRSEGLRAGWNHGNAFGYQAILRDERHRSAIHALPASALTEAWRWNFGRGVLQATYADAAFVPAVFFMLVDGKAVRAATWGDGIPLVVPQVEYLIVVRDALRPKGLFGFAKKEKDLVWVPFADARALLERHRRPGTDDFVLDWSEPPKDVVDFVRKLRVVSHDVKRLSPDKVLDEELVAQAISQPSE